MSTHSSWLNPKVEVRKSRIHGKGVFAKEYIGTGERVAIFGGQIMPIGDLDKIPPPLDEYPMQIEERFLIGSRTAKEPEDTDFFNHSCDPNCGFKGQLFLVAMRDIKPDEELTFDYAMVLSKSVGSDIEFEMKCRCKSKKCRKHIYENDWEKPILQQRYKGFFSQYLEDKMSEQDFMQLHEGDLERSLNKRIDSLIEATESFIVYLDEELFVEWSTNDRYDDFSKSFGEVSNAVAHLETLSISLLSKRQMKPFRRLLGEGMARSLDHEDSGARKVIALAEDYLKARSMERARMWYLASSLAVTIVSFAIGVVVWLMNDGVDAGVQALAQSVPFGALGAAISIITRTSKITLDAAAGALIHFVEGAARVVVGLVGALMLTLAVKSNLIIGFAPLVNGDIHFFLIVLCFAAGASERIVPTLIQRVEVKVAGEKTESNRGTGKRSGASDKA
jgi:hypothetical protein